MPILSQSERQRLLNAIVYFAGNTHSCGKIKLFKLLYLFDFEHFRQMGKSATGLDYQAWKFGPVPVELMEEWEELGDDMGRLVQIAPERVIDFDRQSVKVRDGVVFDPDEFSPRQLRIMAELATRYKTTYSPAMIDVTHAQNGAWEKVWQGGSGAHALIPYELALDEDAAVREPLQELAREQAMYKAALLAARQSDLH